MPGRGAWSRWGLAAWLGVSLLTACQEYPQTTIDPATSDFGGSIHSLYVMIFWWTMVILAVVWALLFFVLLRFRDKPGRGVPKQVRGNLLLEIGWTLGPAIIVVLISVPTVRTVFRTQARAPEDALTVEVIGHQWWWEFRYPDAGVVTANELHIPVGRPVELTLSSADVIHSFWVPRLGGKRDLMPPVRRPGGEVADFNRLVFTVDEEGVYHGQCAEFCGTSHGLMGLRVMAQGPGEFEAWLQGMSGPPSPADSGSLAERGREVFMRSTCVACHAIAGTNAQGQLGPNLTRVGARSTLGAGMLENTPANLERWIRDPAAIKPGVKMPGVAEGGGGMPPTGLSEEQLDAVVAYLSSLR